MKKIIYSAAAMALAFFAVSCQQENLEPIVKANTVTYTVQVADAVATKALGDDVAAVNELVYEVYRTKAVETKEFTTADNLLYHKTAEIKNGVATIELEFVNDQNFTVLFWAHTAGNTVYDVDDLTSVTITSPDDANNVNAQAFVGRDFVRDCVSDANGKVTLHRPVSQLNIATTPASLNIEGQTTVDLEGSSVKVTGLYTTYNIATLCPTGATATEYTYTETAVPTDALTVNGESYTYVAMNYVGFAPEVGTNVTVSYVINTTEGNIDNEIVNVPVKPNYRTNIVGNLITSKTEYTITLEDEWYTPENVLAEAWSQTGSYAYAINEGAPAATLAAVLAHADAAAKAAATKSAEGPVVTIALSEGVVWETGAGIGSTPLLPEDSPISTVVINGNGKTFTATGAGVGQVRLANGALLTFNNVKVVDLSVSYAENSWEYGYLEFAGNLEFNNCEFVNAIMVEGETAAFADCSFNSHDDNQYAVWVNSGATTFTGCTFAGARGLKVHEAYGSEVASVVVDDCLFTELTKKPGIALGDLNAETAVTIENSTFDRCQSGDQKNYMYETDTDVTTFAFSCENNVVIPSGDAFVEQEDESWVVSSVEGLKKALASVTNGKTIYLADGTYDALFLVGTQTFTLKALNAGQAVIAGRVCVAGNQESVITCEDLHFAVSENTSGLFNNQYYDKTKGYIIGNYSGSIVVKNCKFTGMTDDFGAIYYYSFDEGNATTEKLEKLVVENCQFEGGRAIRSRSNVSVTGSQFKGLINPCLQVLGIGASDVHSTVEFTGNTSDAAVSGVCIKTSNFVTQNITFNVGDNTNCNVISFDSKNLNNLYPETYTFAGEVKALSAEDSAGLKYLMSKAQAGDTINLLAGSYKMESYKAGVKIQGVDRATVVVDVQGAKFGVNGDVNIENVTLKFKNDNYMGFQHTATELYKNCNIEGQPFLYGENVTYDACTFTQTSSDLYNVWTYGAKNVTFNSCTFNSAGKAVLVYAETAHVQNVTFNDCVLNASVPVAGKAAVEIDSSFPSGGTGKYTINLNNTVANGFAEGSVSKSTLWNVKKGEANCDVLVNGKNMLADGVATENGAYLLLNAKGLYWFADQVNVAKNAFNGKTVKLAADIDLANAAWTPVGQTGATQFKGTFDGQGKTISNLNIDVTAQTGGNYSSGLFGWLNAATVKNVNVNYATVKGNHNVAVIAGYLETSGCSVINCHVENAALECHVANDDANGDKCAVIVAYANNAGVLVKDCTAKNSTVSAGRDAGQVVGAAKTDYVVNCSATNVTVTANGEGTGKNIRNEVIGRVL